MNKNIYIREEDELVWERARKLAGAKGVSTIVVQGLKKYIAEMEAREAEAKGFERIVLSYQDANENLIPKKKAFTGKWIVSPDKPFELQAEPGDMAYFYAVAITPKNAAVVYHWRDDGEHFFGKKLDIYPSLHDAAADSDVKWVAIKAIEQIGVPVEELDI
jgi:hypothetical protein